MAPDLLRNQILQSLDRVPDRLLLSLSEFIENLTAEAQGDSEELPSHFATAENDSDEQLELVNGFLIVKPPAVPAQFPLQAIVPTEDNKYSSFKASLENLKTLSQSAPSIDPVFLIQEGREALDERGSIDV